MGDELVTRSKGSRQRPTSPRRLRARERELLGLEMRKAGLTFEAIGERLNISRVGARKAVNRALAAHIELTRASAEELRELELARLDALQLAVWPKAMAGDTDAVRTILRTMEHRSRLLGLEAPRPLVAIDQRQVSIQAHGEPQEYQPMEPEKMALAKALLEIHPKKREFLMSAPENGLRPVEALAELVGERSSGEDD